MKSSITNQNLLILRSKVSHYIISVCLTFCWSAFDNPITAGCFNCCTRSSVPSARDSIHCSQLETVALTDRPRLRQHHWIHAHQPTTYKRFPRRACIVNTCSHPLRQHHHWIAIKTLARSPVFIASILHQQSFPSFRILITIASFLHHSDWTSIHQLSWYSICSLSEPEPPKKYDRCWWNVWRDRLILHRRTSNHSISVPLDWPRHD